MIILTDKKLVIPVGIAPNYAGAGNADVKLQAKSVTITENGSKTLFPDGNYNGFSQVNITTNVANNPVLEDKSVEIIENGDYSFIPGPTYDGIGNFRLKVNVETHAPIQVQAVKTAYPSFENDVTVIPSEGYEAMSSVIVKKAEVNLQSKSVTINENGSTSFTPDANFMGLSKIDITTNVELNPVLETRNEEITENGSYKFTPSPAYDGIGNLDLVVNVPEQTKVESSKTAYPSFEQDVTVTPSVGFDAMGTVIVKKAEPNLQDKTVNKASTSEVVLRADAGYQGLGTVTVAPIKVKTMSFDPSTNVQEFSANTENNEYITNVTVNPVNTTSISVDPSTNSQVVNAHENEYITSVTVNPVGTKTVTLDSSTIVQTVNANVEGNEYITSVTVNPVKTTSINVDPSTNSQVVNAPENEYITSVTVNPVGTKTVTVDPSTNSQEVNANVEGNEYITSVTVNPVGTKTVTLDPSTNRQTFNANTEGNEYITSVTVNPVKTTSLSITPKISEQTFTAEQQLYKTVNVSAIKHTEKTYDASTNTQTYNYAENNDVFIKNLTINPVTSSIDPNIVPENIAKGVSILGVTGTLEGGGGNANEFIGGPALTIKFKVKEIFYSNSTTSYTVHAAGKSGYICLFKISPESLSAKGIIAYAINGELHKITDPSDRWIPYTKKTSDYDDVVVDVYVDFDQSGRYCAAQEGADYETSPYYGSSYNYLPNIIDYTSEYFYNYCTIDKTIVRSTVNAIGKNSFSTGRNVNSGMLIFEPGVDGIKRFAKLAFGVYIENFDIYIYGNMAEFPSFFNKKVAVSELVADSYAKIYGNIENYPDNYLTDVNLLSTKLHGIIKTVSNTTPKLYKVTGTDIIDYYEGCTENNWYYNGRNRIIIPASCTSLLINKYSSNTGKYTYLSGNTEIVFFGTTPPSLLNEGTPQQLISINDTNTNSSKIERVFIPAGSNYDSILREAPYRPQVIQFTPVTDLSTINGAGYYGYTAPDGSHILLNVAST